MRTASTTAALIVLCIMVGIAMNVLVHRERCRREGGVPIHDMYLATLCFKKATGHDAR
jgi:hypothetical protein